MFNLFIKYLTLTLSININLFFYMILYDIILYCILYNIINHQAIRQFFMSIKLRKQETIFPSFCITVFIILWDKIFKKFNVGLLWLMSRFKTEFLFAHSTSNCKFCRGRIKYKKGTKGRDVAEGEVIAEKFFIFRDCRFFFF